MEIVQVQKSVEADTYILRGDAGELCAIDTQIFPTAEALEEAIKSGRLAVVAEGTINTIKTLFGQEAVDGLKAEVDALTDLETIYQA